MRTEREGVERTECGTCSTPIFFHEDFRKRVVKFWSNKEMFGGFCFWLLLLGCQVGLFLLNCFLKNVKILFFDFLFSPMLLMVIIFDLTFKLHKGKKFLPCFLIGEVALTFTLFLLKMVVYAEDEPNKLLC